MPRRGLWTPLPCRANTDPIPGPRPRPTCCALSSGCPGDASQPEGGVSLRGVPSVQPLLRPAPAVLRDGTVHATPSPTSLLSSNQASAWPSWKQAEGACGPESCPWMVTHAWGVALSPRQVLDGGERGEHGARGSGGPVCGAAAGRGPATLMRRRKAESPGRPGVG